MKNDRSFEDAAIRDTFDDLYQKLQPLVAHKKYTEARREIEKELRLLADGLGGSINDRRAMVNREFAAFLPEDIRTELEIGTPMGEETQAESENELIARMAEEGWKLAKVDTDADTASAEDAPDPGKELFVATRGERKLIFERDKK